MVAVASVTAGIIAALLYGNATLNHFYLFGSDTDAFLFAGLIWHMDLRMTTPAAMNSGSFYATHVSPILYLPGALSRLPGTETVTFFAGTMGVFHGLVTGAAAAAIGVAVARHSASSWLSAAAALLGGCAIALVPLQVNFMRLPHYEILLPAALIALLTALAVGRTGLAAMILVPLLAVREDAGFHAAAFLLAWAAAIWLRERRIDWTLCGFAVLSIACSIAAFKIGPLIAGRSQGQVYELYLGRPLFHHMTLDQIAWRLEYSAYQNAHIWAPIIAVMAAAAWRRDLVLLAGPVAVLPWLILHVGFATHPTLSTLSFYYAFPVLVVLVWPSIAMAARGPDTKLGFPRILLLQTIVIALGFLPMFGPHLPYYNSRWAEQDLTSPEGRMAPPYYAEFVRRMREHGAELGHYVATVSVIGLAPNLLPRSAWLDNVKLDDQARIAGIDSILLFDSPLRCGPAVDLANRAAIPFAYEVRGTRIVLLSHRRPSELPGWESILERRSHSIPLCAHRPATPPAA